MRRINYGQIARVLSWLLIIEAAFMVVPFVTALVTDGKDIAAFTWSGIITLAFGLAGTVFIRPSRNNMAQREGFLLTALVWVVFSIFGMIPF
ncbi:MAG: TrkH family potassium uptake protein, partial [Candidatus Amulumruptor sp.]|nr:TrkH family potassium uptake protein [Candidatus Amulumruptor sp.]